MTSSYKEVVGAMTEIAERTEGTRRGQETGQGLCGGVPEDACAGRYALAPSFTPTLPSSVW